MQHNLLNIFNLAEDNCKNNIIIYTHFFFFINYSYIIYNSLK